MHLPAKANSLSLQTFMANKSLSDSDSDIENVRRAFFKLTFSVTNVRWPRLFCVFAHLQYVA